MTRPSTRSMEQALLAELLAEFRAAQAHSTQLFARFRSSITNDVLDSGAYILDANGLATTSYQTPYGSLFVVNLGVGDMTVTGSPPAMGAPSNGRGVTVVPAHSAMLINLAGTAWTIYGTAGDLVDVQAFTRPWPPAAAGPLIRGGGVQPVIGTNSDFDGMSNFASNGLRVIEHGYIYNGTSWDRLREFGAGGDGLGVAQASQPSSSPFNDVGGAGAAVTRTFAAVAGQRHRLTHVSCSYSAAASTGTGLLTVTDGATVVAGWDVPLAVNTPFTAPLPAGGIQGSINTALVVTLAAGAAGTVGRLNTAKLTA